MCIVRHTNLVCAGRDRRQTQCEIKVCAKCQLVVEIPPIWAVVEKSLNTSDNTKSRIVVDFSFDYIELVPLHIVSDPTKPEDRH